MSPKIVEDYMAMQWPRFVEECPEGGFRLTVPSVPDFEIFGATKEELDSEWRDAFRSHVMGYLATGKVIPQPPTATFKEPPAEGGMREATIVVELDEQMRPREDLQAA